jgi:6-phosphofructokinase 1
MRNVVLGHLQRGGNPNAYDRILAKRYGIAAVEAVLNKKFGQMVRLRGTNIETVSIQEAVGELKLVNKENHIYQTAKKLGLYIN